MKTIDILSFKTTIESYIAEQNMPKELVRLVIKEIYENVSKEAYEEAMREVEEIGTRDTDISGTAILDKATE